MKKLIIILEVVMVMICNIFNSYAEEWMSAEKMDKNTEPLLTRHGDKPSGGYVFNMNGKTYLVGSQASQYTLPICLTEKKTVPWSGGCRMVRNSGYDEVWSVRGVPLNPIQFYDEENNLVYEHMFEKNVCATGYFNRAYYCQLFGSWKVYKSTNMKNWEETDEGIPRQTENLIYADSTVSFNNNNMIPINYEVNEKTEFLSTLGDWIVRIDDDYSFYLSNDNIYFVKIDMPYCNIEHLDSFKKDKCGGLHYDERKDYKLKCIYEYNDNIVVDMEVYIWGDVLRLQISKQYIYDELYRQKQAPYVKYNNQILAFEQPPVIQDDYTLIPIRFLFEQMGAEVTWNQEAQTATITQNNTAITFGIDNSEASVNGNKVSMDIPARLINDKTMVPVRFLSEELGYTVDWDGENRIITIE